MIINGIILSAGYSSRLNEFKPLVLYKEKSFLENIILKLNQVCDKIIIVTGHKKNALKGKALSALNKDKNKNLLRKIDFVFNRSFSKGMFGSIQCGISKMKNCDWAIIHQVDQPGLPQKFYYDFVKEINNKHNWVQPKYKDKCGHPILLNKSLFSLILNEKTESNLKAASRNKMFIKKIWECNYKEIFQDIDTNEDYRNLLKTKNN